MDRGIQTVPALSPFPSVPGKALSLQVGPKATPLGCVSAGNVRSWSRAGPPRGDCHPLGPAASPPASGGLVRATQPGFHVTSRWPTGYLQDLPNRTMGLSCNQSSEGLVPAASLGLLKKSITPYPCGVCLGGSCLLEISHLRMYQRWGLGLPHASPLETIEWIRAWAQEPRCWVQV